MTVDFRRVNIYRVTFEYYRANSSGVFMRSMVVAHENVAGASAFVESLQQDYPGAHVTKVEVAFSNQGGVLVPARNNQVGDGGY